MKKVALILSSGLARENSHDMASRGNKFAKHQRRRAFSDVFVWKCPPIGVFVIFLTASWFHLTATGRIAAGRRQDGYSDGLRLQLCQTLGDVTFGVDSQFDIHGNITR